MVYLLGTTAIKAIKNLGLHKLVNFFNFYSCKKSDQVNYQN